MVSAVSPSTNRSRVTVGASEATVTGSVSVSVVVRDGVRVVVVQWVAYSIQQSGAASGSVAGAQTRVALRYCRLMVWVSVTETVVRSVSVVVFGGRSVYDTAGRWLPGVVATRRPSARRPTAPSRWLASAHWCTVRTSTVSPGAGAPGWWRIV
jgi:hypothetical protein